MRKVALRLKVNGETYEVVTDPWKTLVKVLREDIGLTGAKEGCNTGNCGACTVIIEGMSVKGCLVLASQVQDKEITTIEGLARNGKLNPLQQAFLDHFAVQCGFCTPGMIMTAQAMLDENPEITEEQIRLGIAGNLCRCTGYVKIVEAIQAVAATMSKGA